MKKIFVSEKSRIKQNQVIALCGKTGMVTGAHLHFSMRLKNELIDPINFVNLPFCDDVKKEYSMRGVSIY